MAPLASVVRPPQAVRVCMVLLLSALPAAAQYGQPQNPWGFSGSYSPAQGYGYPGAGFQGGFQGGYPGGGMPGGYPGGYGGMPGGMQGGMQGGFGMGSGFLPPMAGPAGQSNNVLYPSWAVPSPGFAGNSLFPPRMGDTGLGGGLLGFPRGDRRGAEGAPGPGGLVGPVGPLPSWLSSAASAPGAGRKDVPTARADRFQATRLSERVELKPTGEKAFFPLPFWRKQMELGGDAEVRLISTGAHGLLTFSDGTRLELLGPTTVKVTEINEDRLSLRVAELSTFRLSAGRRPVKVSLPEGTVLEVKGAELSVDRAEYQEMLVVRNFGPAATTLTSTLGEVHLAPNQRCWLPLVLNAHPRPVAEIPGGPGQSVRGAGNEAVRTSGEARIQIVGRILMVDGGVGDSAVRWGGASFRLSGGQRLILDPLQGDRFPLGVEPIDPAPQSPPTKTPTSEAAR